jgi:hypothetical protein
MTATIPGAAVVLSVALAAPVAAQPSTLDAVVDRAGAYVAGFERQLSGIVAEERYVQDVLAATTRRGQGRGPLQSRRRTELRSDLLLVRPGGARSWTEFRDVFEADGVPVRDRTERLTKLFLEGSPSDRDQVGRILDESARFNIGDIKRNINTPLFALQILEARNRARFKFTRVDNRVPDTFAGRAAPPAAFRVSTEVWVVQYEETQPGTMIRTSQLKDLPARGRFWIEPDTGEVLMSELVARDRSVRATIDVSYQSEPLVGCLVPIEMREDYQDRRGSHITGAATYGRFRQFQVNVDETFLIKK